MTRERRVIATAMDRLRSFVATGGRPYVTATGKLAVSSRRPGIWGHPPASDQFDRERADAAFFSAVRNEDALRHITRAVITIGVRHPLGHIVMGAE